MEDYVTFEQAQRLKELGFDWVSTHFYDLEEPQEGCIKGRVPQDFNVMALVSLASAPTLSQAQKWLREVKGIIICIEPTFYRNKRPLMGYDYRLFNKDDGWYSYTESETVYDTYEEALSLGIDKTLELLK